MLDRTKYLRELEELVNIDSGSYCREGVNRVQDWFAGRFAKLGFAIEWFELAPGKLGKSFLATRSEARPFDLLILCHADTVFPEGEAAKRPFRVEGDHLRGPGVSDMKGGCLFVLHAMEELLAGGAAMGNIGIFFNSEHELSCPNTRPLIEKLSKASRMVISTEPTRANGAHIKQRKGIQQYTFTFSGVEAHAGNNPQDGVCAVTELANWVLFLKSLQDLENGISVNPGLIKGGMSINTVPKEAVMRVDIRTVSSADAMRIDKAVKSHPPFNPKASVRIEGGITRPPMVPNALTERYCELGTRIGARYGIKVEWAFAGGGSDASFASGMGQPALCALGPVGGGMHTEKEFLDLRDLEARYEEFRDIVREFSLADFSGAE